MVWGSGVRIGVPAASTEEECGILRALHWCHIPSIRRTGEVPGDVSWAHRSRSTA
ncbi:hypothetical protein BCL76_107176 [Streptomyces sp. CG 926]|nr:hypothetical protein BCL76_107176 [Streptomyces sp. CG 926]